MVGSWEVLVNVHSLCDLSRNKTQWDDLKATKSFSSIGLWCILGDFNIVWGPYEKHGIGYEELSLGKRSLFNQFIQEMEVANVLWLVEVLLGTCLMEKLAKSKLDKFMVSCLWFNIFPSSTSFILERNISDRCPIIMKDLRVD